MNFKGWNCPVCRVFNGEEKNDRAECRGCTHGRKPVLVRASLVLLLRRGTLDVEPRLLVVTNRRFGGIALPGGKSDPDEDPKRTACRELIEETGVATLSSELSLLVCSMNPHPPAPGVLVSVYLARYSWGQPRNVEWGTKCFWITFEELLRMSPFGAFYEEHFPDGLHHLRTTIAMGGPSP